MSKNRLSIDSIEQKIRYLESLINLNKFLGDNQNSIKKIKSYYRLNRFAYRRFHSDHGFMHFRISNNDTLASDDIYYQPDTIAKFLGPHQKILELGSGNGANLAYLAKKHPETLFVGVDLIPVAPPEMPKNIKLIAQDYSDLSGFKDESFDLAYAIETLVHSSNKAKIFSEVYRVLKPGGLFIVYDYATRASYDEYDKYCQTAIALISKCGASATIESFDDWKTYFKTANFEECSAKDFGKNILPDLHRLERMSRRVLTKPLLAKILFHIFPRQFTGNILIAYLGYDNFISGEGMYMEWVCQKRS